MGALTLWLVLWLRFAFAARLVVVAATEGEDITDRDAVSAVQLPSNVFQNYGEAEEDDPYRYYQPNYPAPQPVAPDDPALIQDDFELSSPGVHRSVRSVEGEDGEEAKAGPKRRLKRGARSGLIQ